MYPVKISRTSEKGHWKDGFVSVVTLEFKNALGWNVDFALPMPAFTWPVSDCWSRTAIFVAFAETGTKSLTFESSHQYIVADSMYCWAIATTSRPRLLPVGFPAAQSYLIPARKSSFGALCELLASKEGVPSSVAMYKESKSGDSKRAQVIIYFNKIILTFW